MPLKGAPLKWLRIVACRRLKDLSPLAGMKLERIDLTPTYFETGLDILRNMPTLTTIAPGYEAMTPEEFWKRYDAGEWPYTPPE